MDSSSIILKAPANRFTSKSLNCSKSSTVEKLLAICKLIWFVYQWWKEKEKHQKIGCNAFEKYITTASGSKVQIIRKNFMFLATVFFVYSNFRSIVNGVGLLMCDSHCEFIYSLNSGIYMIFNVYIYLHLKWAAATTKKKCKHFKKKVTKNLKW